MNRRAVSCDRYVRSIDEQIAVIEGEIMDLARKVRWLRRQRRELVTEAAEQREAARSIAAEERMSKRRAG
jgi:hypothetical protein